MFQSNLVTLEPFGVANAANSPDIRTNYLLTIDLRNLDIHIPLGTTSVYSVLEFTNPDTINYLISTSRVSADTEDLFQSESSPPNQLPGFLTSQLGLRSSNFAGRLTAEFIESDFNNDGFVNAADFTVLRDNLGAADVGEFGPGDADGNGEVTLADYQFFAGQFGDSLSSTSPANAPVSTAVPEPSSLGLLATVLACLVFTPRHHRSAPISEGRRLRQG